MDCIVSESLPMADFVIIVVDGPVCHLCLITFILRLPTVIKYKWLYMCSDSIYKNPKVKYVFPALGLSSSYSGRQAETLDGEQSAVISPH
jgi:hypothetical protein